MNRRGFLKFLPSLVGGIAVAQAIPFNRVWSFPRTIVVPSLSIYEIQEMYLAPAMRQLMQDMDHALSGSAVT